MPNAVWAEQFLGIPNKIGRQPFSAKLHEMAGVGRIIAADNHSDIAAFSNQRKRRVLILFGSVAERILSIRKVFREVLFTVARDDSITQ